MKKLIYKYRAKLLKRWFENKAKRRDERVLEYIDNCLDIYESLKYRKFLKRLEAHVSGQEAKKWDTLASFEKDREEFIEQLSKEKG